MSERYQPRPVTPDELEAFGEVLSQAFNENPWPAEAVALERQIFEFDRSLAVFDGDAIVGTAGAYSFQLTVPGASTAAAGVSYVSVRPSHRRRGILSAMMRHQLADIAGRGEAVAALFATESGIYGRYGYGCASGELRLTIRRGEGALSPAGQAASGPGRACGCGPPRPPSCAPSWPRSTTRPSRAGPG